MQKIGIIGPNSSHCSEKLYEFGVELGEKLFYSNRILICGGMGGFMEAVCCGAKKNPNTFNGQTIGILPTDDESSANPHIDIPIPTGIGVARNLIIINSSDILITAGGGAGTLSEISFAWQKRKRVLCVTSFGGWAKELAGISLDSRAEGLLVPVSNIEEIMNELAKFYEMIGK